MTEQNKAITALTYAVRLCPRAACQRRRMVRHVVLLPAIVLQAVMLLACSHMPLPATVQTNTAERPDFVDAADIVPNLQTDIRYYGSDNFVGSAIAGYHAPKCVLHRSVAEALAQVQRDLQRDGLALRVFDCYRPTTAVQHFVRWAHDLTDQRSKPQYYPRLDKRQLLGEYIAEHSGHSRGATLDLTLVDCRLSPCQPLDMGTPFDFFDERAHTESALVSDTARANRLRLRKVMQAHGFHNYPLEWWHYTFRPEPTPTTEFVFPVQ